MQVKYKINFIKINTNIFSIHLYIDNIQSDVLYLKLPVWIPGSYMVREFAKNIDFIEDTDTNNRLKKVNKNTWEIKTNGRKNIELKYNVYGYDWTVRTNHINTEHAFINCAAALLYIQDFEHLPLEIEFSPDHNWKKISSNLPIMNNYIWHRKATDIHELYDSFFEIGNQEIHHFLVDKTQYELALFGKNNCDTNQLISDLKKIIASQIKIFEYNPCENYLFIIQHKLSGFGGLEHLNGSVNQIPSFHYQEREKYRQAISLLSHEHFHLWNVKRIKPKELLPYQYDAEQYTELLWFFEGITSYYDDLTCYRAGVFSLNEYINIIETLLNDVQNHAGNHVQTLAESSFDAWIKYYRQNENSINTEVSYYKKGAVVALLIDLYIIFYSNAKYSLDNVMQELFKESISNNYHGLTKEKIINTLEKFANYNWQSFYEKYIENIDELPINSILEELGVSYFTNTPNQIYLGISISNINNQYTIKQLESSYGGYQSGLQVGDEIIAIDNEDFCNNLTEIIERHLPNETINFKINRDGETKEIDVLLTPNNKKNYTIPIHDIASENEYIQQWLHTDSHV